ncbi:hypothetical protein [Enterococcus asini]|uniref:hypothetical protein n=1 Tax=Enterococcus asini TaxID=57732 RepID=UPI000E4BD5E7|nr:hypothetical protein [Enterococcus asini]RGW12399.1 hypothetical protein DWV91_09875 [Enterococcus asini]
MKKITGILLVSILLLSSCGSTEKSRSNTSNSTSDTSSTAITSTTSETTVKTTASSSKETKISLTLESSEFTTDAEGIAIIKGTTTPKAKVKVGLGFLGDSTKADKNGLFQLKYELNNAEEKELKINVSFDGDKKSKKVIITPSQDFIAKIEAEESKEAEESRKAEESKQIEESKEAEESRKAEESKQIEESKEAEESRQIEASKEAEESREKEIGSDITVLSENPTQDQQEILTKLAKQAFKRRFPYKGSKLHTVSGFGKIQDWTQTDDTWFFKCEATIVNAYGAEEKTVIDITILPIGPESGEVNFY